MKQDAQTSINGLHSQMQREADELIYRGAQLAERVLAAMGDTVDPMVAQYHQDCIDYERRWSEAGTVTEAIKPDALEEGAPL